MARCQVDDDDHSSLVDDVVGESSDSGVEEDDQDLDLNLVSAPGVETVCVFPKNSAKCMCFPPFSCVYLFIVAYIQRFLFLIVSAVVPAGEETKLLVGLKNDGKLNTSFSHISFWFSVGCVNPKYLQIGCVT